MRILQTRVGPKQAKLHRAEMKRVSDRIAKGDPLNRGDKGAAVKALQKQLRAADLFEGKITGTFDKRTESAVKALQKARGLEQTGVVDATNVGHVKALDVFVKREFKTKAVVGQRGGDILAMEKRLAQLGYKVGKRDGVFDATLAKAVRKFQKREKLPVSGAIGHGTWKKSVKELREGLQTGQILSASARKQMKNIVQAAIRNSAGKRPMGWCLREVGDILDRVSYGRIGRGKLPRFPYARNVAEYLNHDRRYAKLGLRRLKLDNPYKAPAGAIIVVRPGTPGTSHPTAGDIVIAAGNGRFLNDGEMSYGGSRNFPKGNRHVLGIYVPK